MATRCVARSRRRSVPKAPPVIFLTAHAHTSARVEGLDAGAVDYIVKPFEHAELTARVRAALRTKTVRDMLANGGGHRRADRPPEPQPARPEPRRARCRGARRYGRPLGCLMADIDHFKAVNDAYGHSPGIRSCVRWLLASEPASENRTCSSASAARSSWRSCPRRTLAGHERSPRGCESASADRPSRSVPRSGLPTRSRFA